MSDLKPLNKTTEQEKEAEDGGVAQDSVSVTPSEILMQPRDSVSKNRVSRDGDSNDRLPDISVDSAETRNLLLKDDCCPHRSACCCEYVVG